MKTREFFITMRDKQVVNRNCLKEQIESLPDGRFIFKIEDKSVRTSQQNRYMHLMFSMIQQGFYDIGYNEVRTTEDAKYIMKEMMAEFIECCIQFAAENLNVVIPAPNQQVKMFEGA